MASRTKQKEEARARRLAEERARAERARRERRLRMVGGTVVLALALVAVLIAVSSGSGKKETGLQTGQAKATTVAAVESLFQGIQQSGTTLGNPNARVTVTEFGELECPICQQFAQGAEQQLINNDVKTGKAKLVYRSLETASQSSPISNVFPGQQIAAYAAGKQNKGWDYIMLFSRWKSDRQDPSLATQLTSDTQAANSKGFTGTPTVVIKGPKGEQDFQSLEDYGVYESVIKQVA